MSIEVAPGHCCQVLSISPLSGVVEMIGQPDVRPQLHGELISTLLGARYQGCPRNIRKNKLRHRRGSYGFGIPVGQLLATELTGR